MLTLKGFVTQTLNMRTKFKRVLFVFLGGFFTHIQIVLERFVINSYLRARLQKIESQIWHYTGPGEAGSRMTQVWRETSYILHDSWPSHQEEAAFAVSFRETGTSLLNSLVLKHLPGTWDPGIFSGTDAEIYVSDHGEKFFQKWSKPITFTLFRAHINVADYILYT